MEIFNIANSSMQKANQSIAQTQQQLSTGQRVITPSDDPVASLKILELNDELARIDQYSKNIDSADNTLQQQEGILNGVIEILDRIKELTIQGGNTAVNTKVEYSAMATEIEGRLEELVALANSKDASGDYIFAGFKGDTQPFEGSVESGFIYQGDDGQRRIKISNSSSVTVSDSGRDIFMDIPSTKNTVTTYAGDSNKSIPPLSVSIGNIVDQDTYDKFYPEDMVIKFNDPNDVIPSRVNYTITEKSTGNVIVANQNYNPGEPINVKGVEISITGTPVVGDTVMVDSSKNQDIMTTLVLLARAMREVDDTQQGKEALSKVIKDTLNNVDSAHINVTKKFAALGARMNSLATRREVLTDSKLFTQEVLSNFQDLDFAEASSRLAMQTTILEAAQASFVRITRLSLFSRL